MIVEKRCATCGYKTYSVIKDVTITFRSDGFIYTKIKARRVTYAFYEILEGMFKGNWVHVWDVIN